MQQNTNTLNEKLAEIRLSAPHPNNKNKVFVLLEGDGDIKLFRSILLSEYTDITSICGKKEVISTITTLNAEGFSYPILGICDADFDHLNPDFYNNLNNLFITDYHDMEVQMIESDALMAVIDEHSPTEHYSQLKTIIKHDIYKIAIEIGYARWFNNNQNGNLMFKRLHFGKFTNAKNCNITFDYDKFLSTLLECSTNNKITITQLKAELEKLKQQSKDPLQICNGHDLTKLIAIIIPDNNLNQDKIESALRVAYTADYFKQTKLFKNISVWCNTQNYRMF